MAARRKYERPLPGNPRRLTIDQHIHSKACIKRFTDSTNRVGVLERGGEKVVLDGPASGRFCAKRVWDQRLEHGGLFRRIERAFLTEAQSIIVGGTVTNHVAVTEYVSIWQLRANLDANPPAGWEINGVGATLSTEQEEILESKSLMFIRGSTMLGRFVASVEMLPRHEQNMGQLAHVRWGVATAKGASRFLCPDQPGCTLYFPLTPTIALVADTPDQFVADATVDKLNRDVFEQCRQFVFGHPHHVEAFRHQIG